MTIASWGGSYQDAQSKALFEPAAEGNGHQGQTGNLWRDVRCAPAGQRRRGDLGYRRQRLRQRRARRRGGPARAARLQRHRRVEFLPALKMKYCVGGDVFSTVLAWNTKTYGDNGPQSWADFWDVKKFPGKRAYRDKVAGALEPALMADGVPPEQGLRGAGLRRRASSARSTKSASSSRISRCSGPSGAQQAQLMKDGEVDMTDRLERPLRQRQKGRRQGRLFLQPGAARL